ncbi:hypothetical protein XELAEV_18035802mg [Xenopus laevis]|uniref:Uncharacterized protein n=1 Tax=Xenopus laevis TaxID=8355 RepID=A0A974CGA9_XENLA|nr:hypothetical protein XELAEV_18035802mg [Xenopus laevis]
MGMISTEVIPGHRRDRLELRGSHRSEQNSALYPLRMETFSLLGYCPLLLQSHFSLPPAHPRLLPHPMMPYCSLFPLHIISLTPPASSFATCLSIFHSV